LKMWGSKCNLIWHYSNLTGRLAATSSRFPISATA
jgi:hypothetical protein